MVEEAFADHLMIRQFCEELLAPAIHLTAIGESGRPRSAWFGSDCAGATEWAIAHNALAENIYFSVNGVEPGLPKKAAKTDIRETRFLHVDIDPPKGSAFLNKDKAIAKIKAMDIVPTAIIDSGNGIQALWRLEGAAELDEVESANRSLIKNLEGDPACFNVDRVLRVPGTTNWPNRKKQKDGRVPCAAKLLEFNRGTSVSRTQVSAFAAGARQATLPPITGSQEQISPPSCGFELLTADDFKLEPHDRLRLAIDQPLGKDRSGDGLSCARLMRKRGMTREQIIGVLANPQNAVHAHYRDQFDPIRSVLRTVDKAGEPFPEGGHSQSPALPVQAKAFVARDPATIPVRPWVIEGWLLRHALTAVLAPGGVGKSSFSIATAISLAAGRDLFGMPIIGGPKKVWYWNLEDDGDELERQVHAALRAHGLNGSDIEGRFFLNSGPDGSVLCLAKANSGVLNLQEAEIQSIEDQIRNHGIDVVMLDPWVSSHQVDENSNTLIDPIVKRLARAAKSTSSAWMIVHHTSKPKNGGSSLVNTDASRGASAFTNAVRVALTLNRMTESQGEPYGISGPELRRYVRVSADKHNRSAPSDGLWFELVSIELENGDVVGAVKHWQPPKVSHDTSPETIRSIQSKIAGGNYRENAQAGEWAGYVVAEALGLAATDKKVWKRKVQRLLKAWVEQGYFKVVRGVLNNRKEVSFLAVGHSTPEDVGPRMTADGLMDFAPDDMQCVDCEGAQSAPPA